MSNNENEISKAETITERHIGYMSFDNCFEYFPVYILGVHRNRYREMGVPDDQHSNGSLWNNHHISEANTIPDFLFLHTAIQYCFDNLLDYL